jgi:hypothetical protein
MKTDNTDFEKRKKVALDEAREAGIVDIVSASGNISLETVQLATALTKKHGPSIQKSLAARRKAQK